MKKMGVAIVGAGLIGRKRGLAAIADKDVNITTVVDVNEDAARKLAADLESRGFSLEWRDAVRSTDVDVVIIATPNYLHAPIAMEALKNNKHVLCEKPLTTKVTDSERMVRIAKEQKLVLKTGFNHRHFPHIAKAKEICDSGILGDLYYVRAHYGHGGRKGYDADWRMNAELAGGGQLMDQGVHIIDLGRWFLGDFVQVSGFTNNFHWGSDTIEDNSFFSMKTAKGQVLHAHVSWTQWKNSFLFEIFGSNGYLRLTGLAGYYGSPTIVQGLKVPPAVVPVESVFEFSSVDVSFTNEWRAFRHAIDTKSPVLASGEDGLEVLKLVMSVYESEKKSKVINEWGKKL